MPRWKRRNHAPASVTRVRNKTRPRRVNSGAGAECCFGAGWASGRSLAAGISSYLTARRSGCRMVCERVVAAIGVLRLGRATTAATSLRMTNEERTHAGRLQDDKQYTTELLKLFYRARASTRVTSSGCSPPAIQSVTAPVTSSLMRASDWSRCAWISSIRRSSPNSPNSFSGSVTPSL